MGNSFTRNFDYFNDVNQLREVLTGSSATIESFTYDNVGNQITVGSTRHYQWSAANRLFIYKNQTGVSDPTIYTQYDYDAGGNRVSKLIRTGTNIAPIYERTVYIDGIFEYHKLENGTTYEKNYVQIMDDKSRICEVRVGTPFPDDIAEDTTYILEDQIGSSVARLDTSGGFIDIEEYYPFGDSSLRTFSKKRYRYVGKEKDLESGLYYYGARYYAAWTCRFISVDPLANKYVQLSPYNYANNGPIDDYDIDGMQDTTTVEQPTVPNDTTITTPQATDSSPNSQPSNSGTHLIVHGAGWDNPATKGHNQGANFQKSAEMQKQNLIAQGVPESSIVVAKVTTEQDFLDVVNTTYESGKITQLDIYAHMSNNAINFGGNDGDEIVGASNEAKDYRVLNNWTNKGFNPEGDNEVERIDAANFNTNSRITLWGCNAGWGINSIAQSFSDHMNSSEVRAFDDWSRFKTDSSGNIVYDGTMIREIDSEKIPQPVKLQKFSPQH